MGGGGEYVILFCLGYVIYLSLQIRNVLLHLITLNCGCAFASSKSAPLICGQTVVGGARKLLPLADRGDSRPQLTPGFSDVGDVHCDIDLIRLASAMWGMYTVI